MKRSLMVVMLSLMLSLLPVFGLQAQDAQMPGVDDVQGIAHGVARMPGARIAWQVSRDEAGPASRASASKLVVGFLLADEGVIAVTDGRGAVLQRLTPGEAVWTEPGAERAVVSLDGRRNDYYRIGLVATQYGESIDDNALTHEAFAAPAEHAIVVELLRDVLERAAEREVPASGETPMLLLVTHGKVFVEAGTEPVRQLSAGESVQIAGPAVVVGASRNPAAFVAARIGPSVPQRMALAEATPGMSPPATPVTAPRDLKPEPDPIRGEGRVRQDASLAIMIRSCPAGMSPDRLVPDACVAAPPGTTFTLRRAGSSTPLGVAQARPDAWGWQDLDAGSYALDVNGLPVGFVTAMLDRQSCCGDGHDFSLSIPPGGGEVEHVLYLLPPAGPRESTLSVDIRACPVGMTAETLIAARCEAASPGTVLSLREWGAPLGVSALSASTWVWQGLGPHGYQLGVRALPRGFASYHLVSAPRRRTEDGMEIDLGVGEPDAQRVLYLFQPAGPGDAANDSDEDRLIDGREGELGTHPFLADSDGDGVVDGEEVDLYGTDPLRADTDGDGLTDAEELATRGTNPLLADTDGDGASDDREVSALTDPLDVASVPVPPTTAPIATPWATPSD